MDNGLLALVEGKPTPKPQTNSLWAALHERASIDPDRLALLSPRQPANLLSGLVQPWPRGRNQDGGRSSSSGSGSIACAIKRATSPACILNYLLSWFLPAPAADRYYLKWSFAELQRATIRLGSLLRRRGVKPGGATAVFFTPICAEWALLLCMSALNRYTAVTLDSSSALAPCGEHMLQEHIDTLAPSLIVVATEEEALYLASNIKTNINLGISLEKFTAPAPEGWVSMAEIAAAAAAAASQVPAHIDTAASAPDNDDDKEEEEDDLDRIALVVYTSGSSGKPKGCPVSAGQLLSALGVLSKQLPLLPAPITLVSGVSFQSRCPAITMMSWATGNAAVINAGESSAETILAALETCRPISISLLVTAVGSIARAPNYSADAIKSVRLVHLIGATVTMAILRTAQKTFPRARILPSFGLTEAAVTATWPAGGPPSIDKMPAWHGIAASGNVAPGAALKVVGADARVVRRGQVGTLHLRGDSVITGYLGGGSSSSRSPASFYMGDDGYRWFVSGDDAVIDDQGFLYVLGRSEFTLGRDGEVIIPCTIENFLETQFEGSTAAVVNITTRSRDTGLFAVFERAVPASSPIDIQELVARKLGPAYRIEGAASLGEVGFGEWPLTLGGKIAYRDLRPALEAYIASEAAKS